MKPTIPKFLRAAGLVHGGRTACLALLLGSAVINSAAIAASDPQAARLYEDALIRYEKQDTAGAVIQLKNALQRDRTLLPVHVLLGKALLADSDVIGAEVALTEALRLGVDRAEVVVPLAQAVLGQGRRQPLVEEARFATAGLPAGIRAQLLLIVASAQADLGKPRDAMKAIEEARGLIPTSAESWQAEVPIRIRARQFAEAAAAADRARALAPSSAEAVYLCGSVAHTTGQLAAALAAYDQAIALAPGHLESLLARAGIAIDQNRLADARRDIAAARRTQPKEPRGAYLGAVIAEREGDARGARSALAEITALIDPVPPEFLRHRTQLLILGGLAHHGLGQMEKARPYFEMVQREQPASPVSKLLAQIHLADKNVDRAIESLDGYLRGHPGDAQALALLASAHMSQGRHARATQIMSDALKARDSPRLRTLLGVSLLGSGKPDDARAELEAAFHKDPAQLQAGAALVALYLRDQQPKKAAGIAESLVQRAPAQPGLHNLLGMALLQLGDLPRAGTAFERAQQLDPAFVQARINLARLDIRAKRPDAAVTRLNALLQTDDKQVEVLSELGLLAESRGQAADATRYLARAADVSAPNDVQAGLQLFEHHLRAGRVAAAQDVVRRLEIKAPEDIAVLLANARGSLAARSNDAARAHLVKATRIAAFDAPLQTRIALLQMAAGDAKGAAYSLSKALTGDPEHLPALALMTDAELKLGDIAAADQRARGIRARHPQAAIGHALAGDVAVARGQTKAAVDHYRRAHEIEPTSQSLQRLQRALGTHDPAAAAQLAERWLKSHPRDIAVRRNLADGHVRNGQLLAARSAYERLLETAPNQPEALNNYAHVLLDLKDLAGATRAADRALASQPDAAHIVGTAGWVAFRSGQADRALQLLRDARLRDPNNPDTRYYLAAVLAAAGRPSEAKLELQSALRSPAFATARQAQSLLQTMK